MSLSPCLGRGGGGGGLPSLPAPKGVVRVGVVSMGSVGEVTRSLGDMEKPLPPSVTVSLGV